MVVNVGEEDSFEVLVVLGDDGEYFTEPELLLREVVSDIELAEFREFDEIGILFVPLVKEHNENFP